MNARKNSTACMHMNISVRWSESLIRFLSLTLASISIYHFDFRTQKLNVDKMNGREKDLELTNMDSRFSLAEPNFSHVVVVIWEKENFASTWGNREKERVIEINGWRWRWRSGLQTNRFYHMTIDHPCIRIVNFESHLMWLNLSAFLYGCKPVRKRLHHILLLCCIITKKFAS